MNDFSYLWSNVLLSYYVVNASRENKAEFGIKGQGKLEQNPPVGAAYGPLILASRGALDLFLSLKNGTSLNMQKAATERLDALVPVIVSTGKVLEGKILSEFETDPSVRTEFFPAGRSELGDARRGDMSGILDRLVNRATAHQAQLGAAWVTRLTTLRTQWNTNIDIQSGATSQVETSRSQIDLVWESLSWAFYDIAQQLATDNPRHPEVADAYFNFSMFTRRTNANIDQMGLIKILLTDFGGNPIVNGRVVIRDQNGQDMETGIADSSGNFVSKDLPIGFYDVTLGQPGFVTRTQQLQVFDDNDPVHEVQLSAE